MLCFLETWPTLFVLPLFLYDLMACALMCSGEKGRKEEKEKRKNLPPADIMMMDDDDDDDDAMMRVRLPPSLTRCDVQQICIWSPPTPFPLSSSPPGMLDHDNDWVSYPKANEKRREKQTSKQKERNEKMGKKFDAAATHRVVAEMKKKGGTKAKQKSLYREEVKEKRGRSKSKLANVPRYGTNRGNKGKPKKKGGGLPVECGQWPPVHVEHLAGEVERFAPRRPWLPVQCLRYQREICQRCKKECEAVTTCTVTGRSSNNDGQGSRGFSYMAMLPLRPFETSTCTPWTRCPAPSPAVRR